MIIGTAGHIDHGKSALVAALTGRRWIGWRRSGGAGSRSTSTSRRCRCREAWSPGVVDVPGHEDFVRTMVAGASGIDVALLVIAADEGLMPQTIEHLAVLEHLGVPAAIPVVTKADLVEPEWLELVLAEVSEWLAPSPIGFEPPVATSVRTGAGLDELRGRLAARAARLEPRRGTDLFRLPVDRSFSVAGVGTVVTGTAWSGRVATGDAVRLLPSGGVGRVRSIETYGRALSSSEPGARTAVGLAGVTREAAQRGSWLVAADAPWQATRALDVELRLQADAPALARAAKPSPRAPWHGRGHGPGPPADANHPWKRRARPPGARGPRGCPCGGPPGAPELQPGQHDRRGASARPASTPPTHALARRTRVRSRVGALRCVARSPTWWPARRRASTPPRRSRRGCASGCPGPSRGAGGRGSSGFGWRCWTRSPGASWRRSRRSTAPTRPSGACRSRLSDTASGRPDPVVERAVSEAAAAGRIRVLDGVALLSGFVPRVQGGDAEVDRVVRILEEAELSPPSLPELERQTGRRDIDAILRLAARSGRVEAVEREPVLRASRAGAVQRRPSPSWVATA